MIKILIIINILLLAGQFYLSTHHASDGRRLAQITHEVSELESRNRQLQVDIYTLSSLENIASRVDLASLTPASLKVFSPPPVAQVVSP